MSEEHYPGEADEAATDEASCMEPMTPHALTREPVEPSHPPPDAQAMTREQLEKVVQHHTIGWGPYSKVNPLLEHDAAQRETIRRLEGERDAAQFMAKRAMDELTKAQARLTASETRTRSITEAVLAAFGWELNLDSGGKDGTLFRRTDWKTSPAPIVYAMTVEEILQHGYPIHQPKKWTTARPTVAGWYWHRWSDGSDKQIVKVQQDTLTRNWFCYHVGSAITYSIPRIDDRGDKGEWQGPLTPGE